MEVVIHIKEEKMNWSDGNPKCPDCGKQLEKVVQSARTYAFYSPEQFDAAKAGDWMCPNKECPGIEKIDPDKLSKKGHRCYWQKDLV